MIFMKLQVFVLLIWNSITLFSIAIKSKNWEFGKTIRTINEREELNGIYKTVNIFSFSVLNYWVLFVWRNFPFLFQLGLSLFLIYTPCILLFNTQVNKNFFCIFFSLLFSVLCLSHYLFFICNKGSSEPLFLYCDFVWLCTLHLMHHIRQGIFIFINCNMVLELFEWRALLRFSLIFISPFVVLGYLLWSLQNIDWV